MRDFTTEEKELIVNTPIHMSCFDLDGLTPLIDNFKIGLSWETIVKYLEQLRQQYIETSNEQYFTELVRLLPNSYKVVNLCAERKDICKNKHQVSVAPHYYNHFTAKPCYEVSSCDKCDCFKI